MSVICPGCTSKRSDSERYCPICGTRLTGADRQQAEAVRDAPAGAPGSSPDDAMEFVPLVFPDPPKRRRFGSRHGGPNRWVSGVVALILIVATGAVVWGAWVVGGEDDDAAAPPSQSQTGDISGIEAAAGIAVATPEAGGSLLASTAVGQEPAAGALADSTRSTPGSIEVPGSPSVPRGTPVATMLPRNATPEPEESIAHVDDADSARASTPGTTLPAPASRPPDASASPDVSVASASTPGSNLDASTTVPPVATSIAAIAPASTSTPGPWSGSSSTPQPAEAPISTVPPSPTESRSSTATIEPTATSTPDQRRAPASQGTPISSLAPDTPAVPGQSESGLASSARAVLDWLVGQAQDARESDAGTPASAASGDGTGGVMVPGALVTDRSQESPSDDRETAPDT